ncbi:type VI secretion system baseplate subunit TssK [Massilia sp. TS11]|uniref:type VI secretion system baseplate subunit TssK n=1 Tax=Massilia sp. TS11 TaxID=2908003 RepID=UPI001EDA0DAD|nr:type VI secretion system baseplate subunit TssK [Massilia sp. TS11]MCG2583072.1 type VI secretion system baseplate subunit TssK [Massilia sp. TS11]
MMRVHGKLHWSEGLSLGPQHFQYQDVYHEQRLQTALQLITPHAWGLRELLWQRAALADNLLICEAVAAVFPDGEQVEAPGRDLLPEPLNLAGLAPGAAHLLIYLCLPQLKPQGANVDAAEARYASVLHEVEDLHGVAMAAPVSFLCQRLQLLPDTRARSGMSGFPVARLRRLAAGGFEFDPEFVAPSLHVRATPTLGAMLDSLLAKLCARIDQLHARQRQGASGVLEPHHNEAAAFWLLQTLSRACAPLLHMARQRQVHPARLFDTLLELAGALMALSRQYALHELPHYDHADPGPAFTALDRIVRELTDTIISSKCFPLALVRDAHKSTHYRAQLDAARIDERTALFIAVNADMPALELVAAVPLRFKLGAPDDVERIIVSALGGVELLYTPQLPGAVPVRPNTYYFALVNKGPMYAAMLRAQALSLYVPEGFAGLRLELLAVTD